MYVLEVNKKTIFVKLLEIFPECFHLIEDSPQLYPLFCLKNEYCPRNMNCMERLVKRVKHIFDSFPDSELLVLYFKYRNEPEKLRAGVFWKDMETPRFIKINLWAWEKMKEIGTVYEWKLPDSLFLS